MNKNVLLVYLKEIKKLQNRINRLQKKLDVEVCELNNQSDFNEKDYNHEYELVPQILTEENQYAVSELIKLLKDCSN